MSGLQIKELKFGYGSHIILRNISLSVSAGEIMVLVGQSGSGKSTLLKIMGGLLEPLEGSVIWNGRIVPGPQEKLIAGHNQIKLVSQDFNLMPFIHAEENIYQGMMRLSNEEKQRVAINLMETLGIENVFGRMTRFLSGGQQQRVAIAKALASNAELILFDEVFNQLDQSTKLEVMTGLRMRIKSMGITAVFVLHEPQDAFFLADKIVVLNDGRIEQQGSIEEVYSKPLSRDVARLFGKVNELDVLLAREILREPIKNYHQVNDQFLIRPYEWKLSDLKTHYTILSTHINGRARIHRVEVSNKEFWFEE
jgi:iron(III) transport system ATP-binding protein